MKLLTQEVRKRLPPLYAQEGNQDPVVHVKFFCPWNQWTWYATEGSAQLDSEHPEQGEIDFIFFGYVIGFEQEWGYFSLSELEALRGPAGLRVERDLYFTPRPVSQLPAYHLPPNPGG